MAESSVRLLAGVGAVLLALVAFFARNLVRNLFRSLVSRRAAVMAPEFGFQPSRGRVTGGAFEEGVHATVIYRPAAWQPPSLKCRICISCDAGAFTPAHVDGLDIKATFEETEIHLHKGDAHKTVPLAVRLAGMSLPVLFDRPMLRGETKQLAVGVHRVRLRLRYEGETRHQDYLVNVPANPTAALEVRMIPRDRWWHRVLRRWRNERIDGDRP